MASFWNWWALAFFAGSLYYALRIGRRSGSFAVWCLAGGFLWSVIVRSGISFHLSFFGPNSRPLTAVTATLFFIGMFGIDRASKHFTKRNGNGE